MPTSSPRKPSSSRKIQRHQATEKQLRDATAQIERATLAKSEFLAKMSHELKNPLNSIIGYSEMLLDEQESANDQKYKDLNSIKDAGHRLLELINDLLDLSKLEAGKMELQLDRIEIRSMFDEIAENWRAAITDNGNEFKLQPPAVGVIRCDAGKLGRVITSLLSNAAKFTANGCVAFSASMEGGVLTVSVADTGIGIVADRINKLFETFGRSEEETASNYADDVRLGLPLAQRYCRLMGGELSVESQVGYGSCFTIRTPVELLAVDGRHEPEPVLEVELLTKAAA